MRSTAKPSNQGQSGVRFLVGIVAGASLICDAFGAELHAVGTINDGWGQIRQIALTGKITPGDATRLSRAVTGEDSWIVVLDSPGGDYKEGLALAELFKQRKIRTVVRNGMRCLSACAIAFLGGSALGEEGTEPFARSIGQTSRLGFHAPFIDLAQGALTVARVEAAYDQAIKTVTDFVRAAKGLGVEPQVAADMMTPQRTHLYSVETVRDLARIGIEVQGIEPPQTFTESMLRNLCVNGLAWDKRGSSATISSDMEVLLRDLAWKSAQTFSIETGHFSTEVIAGKRSVLPMFEAGEGSGYYACVVDHVRTEDQLQVMVRGYVFAETPEGLIDRAHELDGTIVSEDASADIPARIIAGAIDPLNRSAYSIENRWALVPETTRIDQIVDVLKNYSGSEPPL